MSAKTADVHFELYAQREGRWVLDACFADEDEARGEAARVARRSDVRGARLVREVHLPGTAEPIVTTLLDSTEPDHRGALRPPEDATTASRHDAKPASLLGDTRRHAHRAAAPQHPADHARTVAPTGFVVALGVLSALLAAAVAVNLILR